MKFLGKATDEEVAAAFDLRAGTTYERTDDEQVQYDCRRCARAFFASPKAWILSSLCDPCFAEADREKWERAWARRQAEMSCDHCGTKCCTEHDTHVMPHVGCILR